MNRDKIFWSLYNQLLVLIKKHYKFTENTSGEYTFKYPLSAKDYREEVIEQCVKSPLPGAGEADSHPQRKAPPRRYTDRCPRRQPCSHRPSSRRPRQQSVRWPDARRRSGSTLLPIPHRHHQDLQRSYVSGDRQKVK